MLFKAGRLIVMYGLLSAHAIPSGTDALLLSDIEPSMIGNHQTWGVAILADGKAMAIYHKPKTDELYLLTSATVTEGTRVRFTFTTIHE